MSKNLAGLLGWLCLATTALAFEGVVEEAAPSAAEELPADSVEVCEVDCEGAGAAVGPPAAKPKKKRFFDDSAPVKLTMQTDFAHLRTVYGTKPVPGTISHEGKTVQAEFQVRGKVRRAFCSKLPPIKIVRAKGEKGGLFHGVDRDMKFVTHCTDGRAEDQDVVLAEYALYKILEAAGFPVFRVRLAETTYLDPAGAQVAKGTGFFIENVKDYAKREGYTAESLARESIFDMQSRFLLSQRLIRNEDHKVTFGGKSKDGKAHNVRIIRNGKNDPLAYVPYDFDLSDLAGRLPWVKPADEAAYNRKSAEEARRGFGMDKHIAELLGKRAAIERAIQDAPLSQSERTRLRNSVLGFLDALARPAGDSIPR